MSPAAPPGCTRSAGVDWERLSRVSPWARWHNIDIDRATERFREPLLGIPAKAIERVVFHALTLIRYLLISLGTVASLSWEDQA